MNRNLRDWRARFGLALVLAMGAGFAVAASGQSTPPVAKCPPPARVDNVTDMYGTTAVVDPYRWLEDQNSPETRAWIDQENACTDAALSKIPGRDAIDKRLTDLYHADTYSLPIERGNRYFFTKRAAGQDLSQIYMRRGRTGADEVLVDPTSWSADHSVSASLEAVSRDGKLLFYGRREGGQDETAIHALNVETHSDLSDVLPSAVYFSVTPTPDDRGVYYAKATPDGPRGYYHAMGTTADRDKIIFGSDLGKDKILGIDLSNDGAYLLYTVVYGSGSAQDALYIQNIKDHGPVVTIVNDIVSQFYGFFAGHTLYIDTNWNAARWHVFATDLDAPSRDHWREVIPEASDVLDGFDPVGGKLVTEYLHDATSEIKVFDADGIIRGRCLCLRSALPPSRDAGNRRNFSTNSTVSITRRRISFTISRPRRPRSGRSSAYRSIPMGLRLARCGTNRRTRPASRFSFSTKKVCSSTATIPSC
jgi:prolyl oligopeptidase